MKITRLGHRDTKWVSSCCWKNGADSLARSQVATKHQFVKTAESAKCNKANCNKMRWSRIRCYYLSRLYVKHGAKDLRDLIRALRVPNEQTWDFKGILLSMVWEKESTQRQNGELLKEWNSCLILRKPSTDPQDLGFTLHVLLWRKPPLHKWWGVKPGLDLKNLSSSVVGHHQACSMEGSGSLEAW